MAAIRETGDASHARLQTARIPTKPPLTRPRCFRDDTIGFDARLLIGLMATTREQNGVICRLIRPRSSLGVPRDGMTIVEAVSRRRGCGRVAGVRGGGSEEHTAGIPALRTLG